MVCNFCRLSLWRFHCGWVSCPRHTEVSSNDIMPSSSTVRPYQMVMRLVCTAEISGVGIPHMYRLVSTGANKAAIRWRACIQSLFFKRFCFLIIRSIYFLLSVVTNAFRYNYAIIFNTGIPMHLSDVYVHTSFYMK